nr:hypothetical protein GCM10017745_03240 [Saccharothrix mutabilis subsp. capreolus]
MSRKGQGKSDAKKDAERDMRKTGFIPARKCPPHDDVDQYMHLHGTTRYKYQMCGECGRETNPIRDDA